MTKYHCILLIQMCCTSGLSKRSRERIDFWTVKDHK